ncbi:MAG: hypothetical protein VX700_09865 [Pseudomonadota bacterium]|nr:hypothetical protein [Pseudomonadota bacterium]
MQIQEPQDLAQGLIEIKDLYFTEQVFVWALRMKVRGKKFFQKVHVEFNNNLSPSAARIAIGSVNSVIQSIQTNGTKSIKLNCTCVPYLSPDEWLLVKFLRKVNNDPGIPWPLSDTDFIGKEGRDNFIHSLLAFQMALGSVDQRPRTGVTRRGKETDQVHKEASVTIH